MSQFAQSLSKTFGPKTGAQFVSFLGKDLARCENVVVQHFKGMGYGLAAARNIGIGEEVLSLSDTIWRPLSMESAAQGMNPEFKERVEYNLEKLENSSDLSSVYSTFVLKSTLFMALHLLQELQNPKSNAKVYLDIISNSPIDVPVFWGQDKMDLLQGTCVPAEVMERRQFLSWLYDRISNDWGIDDALKQGLSPPNFVWAMSLMLSRSISGRGRPYSLVPVVDFINHCPEFLTTQRVPDGYCSLGFDEKTQCFQVKSLCEIPKGGQIFINYGEIGNASLLRMYGFTVQNNTFDRAKLNHPIIGEYWASNYDPVPRQAVLKLRKQNYVDESDISADKTISKMMVEIYQENLKRYPNNVALETMDRNQENCVTVSNGEQDVLRKGLALCQNFGEGDLLQYVRANI